MIGLYLNLIISRRLYLQMPSHELGFQHINFLGKRFSYNNWHVNSWGIVFLCVLQPVILGCSSNASGWSFNACPREFSILVTVENHLFDELVHNLFVVRTKHGWDTYLHSKHKTSKQIWDMRLRKWAHLS